jgi:hypothetical protein
MKMRNQFLIQKIVLLFRLILWLKVKNLSINIDRKLKIILVGIHMNILKNNLIFQNNMKMNIFHIVFSEKDR